MTEITNSELIIRINTTAPAATLSDLMKSLAAAMRWSAYAEKTDDDNENIICLSQFMEALPGEHLFTKKGVNNFSKTP